MEMKKEELDEILEKHVMWLNKNAVVARFGKMKMAVTFLFLHRGRAVKVFDKEVT